MFKADVVDNTPVVKIHGEVVKRGFNYLSEAHEWAKGKNVEYGYTVEGEEDDEEENQD